MVERVLAPKAMRTMPTYSYCGYYAGAAVAFDHTSCILYFLTSFARELCCGSAAAWADADAAVVVLRMNSHRSMRAVGVWVYRWAKSATLAVYAAPPVFVCACVCVYGRACVYAHVCTRVCVRIFASVSNRARIYMYARSMDICQKQRPWMN